MNGYSGACGVATCLLAELMLSRFHTVTLTTLAPYASTLPQIILVLHTSFLACLASPSLSSLDVQIVVLDFKPLMFHELLHVVMVGVLTLLHGFKGSYFKSTFIDGEVLKVKGEEIKVLRTSGKTEFGRPLFRWKMGSNFMKLWWKELDLQKLVDQKNPED
ncbi:hypothetical protein JHK82_040178 [Glycine max]|nr:hypothetical protein JHK82_040178 [Glycine max]